MKANSALRRMLYPYRPGSHPSIVVAHKVAVQHHGNVQTTTYQLTGLAFARPATGSSEAVQTCSACYAPVRVSVVSAGSARLRFWAWRVFMVIALAAFATCLLLSAIVNKAWVWGTFASIGLWARATVGLQQEDGVRLRDRKTHELRFPEPAPR